MPAYKCLRTNDSVETWPIHKEESQFILDYVQELRSVPVDRSFVRISKFLCDAAIGNAEADSSPMDCTSVAWRKTEFQGTLVLRTLGNCSVLVRGCNWQARNRLAARSKLRSYETLDRSIR